MAGFVEPARRLWLAREAALSATIPIAAGSVRRFRAALLVSVAAINTRLRGGEA